MQKVKVRRERVARTEPEEDDESVCTDVADAFEALAKIAGRIPAREGSPVDIEKKHARKVLERFAKRSRNAHGHQKQVREAVGKIGGALFELAQIVSPFVEKIR